MHCRRPWRHYHEKYGRCGEKQHRSASVLRIEEYKNEKRITVTENIERHSLFARNRKYSVMEHWATYAFCI